MIEPATAFADEGSGMDVVSASNGTESRELVRRIVLGDPDAEAEMVRRYKAGVSIIVERIVDCPFSAKDVAQDAFRIALEKIRHGDVREPEKLAGFISSIARNQAIEHVRKARRMTNQEESIYAEHIPSPAPDQFQQLLHKEEAEAVRQVIGELKVARDRVVLYRYFILEEDKEQVCIDLGLTSKQFSSVVFRALTRYRELYLQRGGGR